MQDIRRQFRIAVRWLPLIIIGALAMGGVAYAVTSAQPRVYEAKARLVVNPGPDPSPQELEVASTYAGLYASQLESRSVARAVIEKAGIEESVEDFLKRVSTTTSSEDFTVEDHTLEIAVRDRDPEAARVLALALGDEMTEIVRDRVVTEEAIRAEEAIKATEQAITFSRNRLNTLIAKAIKTRRDRQDIQELFAQISSLRADLLLYQPSARAFVSNRLEWFERPITPDAPVEPRPMFWTLLALVVGGMLAMAIGFVIEYLRDKVRDEHDVEVSTGVATVGTISEKRGDIRRGDPDRLALFSFPASKVADAYRDLRGRITLANGSARSLLVASTDTDDSKSVVAGNLALAYAESGRNVILVDADRRSPRLHSFFGVSNDRGLSTAVNYPDLPLDHLMMATAHPKLRLMPAGPRSFGVPDPIGLERVPELLQRLLGAADMVVFDAASMSTNLDAALLASHVQETVLVVSSGSRGAASAEAARLLESANANLVGTVLFRRMRGSHRRTAVSPPVALPTGETAVASPPYASSRPPVIFYVVVNILYRIFGSPLHLSGAPSAEGSEASLTSGQKGVSGITTTPPTNAPKAIAPAIGQWSSTNPAGAPMDPRKTITVDSQHASPEPPSPGPYAGGFIPPGATPPKIGS